MLNSLKEICVKSIYNNLVFNYSILKSYKWKIPSLICDFVYKFYIESTYERKEDDLKLFTLPSFLISNLDIDINLFKYPEFFSEINTELIRKINLNLYLSIDWISNLENLLKRIKNLEVLNVYFNSPSINDNDLNCKIMIAFQLFDQYLTGKLSKLNISLWNCLTGKKYILNEIKEFLQNCKNLKVFHFRFLMFHDDSNFLNVFKLPKDLEELKLEYVRAEKVEDIKNFFYNFNCLKTVILPTYLADTNEAFPALIKGLSSSKLTLTQLQIMLPSQTPFESIKDVIMNFKLLKKLQFYSSLLDFENLRKDNSMEFDISGFRLDPSQLKFLIDLLQNCKMMDELTLNCIDFDKFTDNRSFELIQHLSKFSKRLHIFLNLYIKSEFNMKGLKYLMNLGNHFFYSLEVRFFHPPNDSILIELEESLSFENIIKFHIDASISFKYINKFNMANFFGKFSKLETIEISYGSIENIFDDICLGLQNSVNTLKNIGFKFCYLKERSQPHFENLLRNCKRLERLLLENNVEILTENIMDAIAISNETLLELSISSSEENLQYIPDFLRKFQKRNDFYITFPQKSKDKFPKEKFFQFFPHHDFYSIDDSDEDLSYDSDDEDLSHDIDDTDIPYDAHRPHTVYNWTSYLTE